MSWLGRLLGKRKQEAELEEEVQNHLKMAAQEHVERGETSTEAERAARREFGNVGLVKETVRAMWGWGTLDGLIGAGNRRKHRVVFGRERSTVQSPAVSPAGTISDAPREQAEL